MWIRLSWLKQILTQTLKLQGTLFGVFFSRREQFLHQRQLKLGASGLKMDEQLQRLLDQQAAVMTCRGAVRDEYRAQMDLSRL